MLSCRHSQDSAGRVVQVLVYKVFTITKCQELSYKTSGLFSTVNLHISHFTCWIRIVNVFKWLEILSSVWGFEDSSKARSSRFYFHDCFETAAVKLELCQSWGVCACVCVDPSDPSVHVQHTPWLAGWPDRFYWEPAPPPGWAAQHKHCWYSAFAERWLQASSPGSQIWTISACSLGTLWHCLHG